MKRLFLNEDGSPKGKPIAIAAGSVTALLLLRKIFRSRVFRRGEVTPPQTPTAGRLVARLRSDLVSTSGSKLPIQLLHDRVLVQEEGPDGERKSTGGIVIPATAQVGKRLVWAEVVGVGPNVRTVQDGDRVLFEPEDRGEVELHGSTYVFLRERDIHAIASARVEGSTGLYL